MKQLIFILLLIPIVLKAQEPKAADFSKTLNEGYTEILNENWRYKVGDSPEWAKPEFDDSSWEMFTNVNLYNKEIQKKAKKTTIIWYRERIFMDSTVTQKLVAHISQSGASEIYLDGELIHTLGKVSNNPDSIVRYNPSGYVPLSFPMKINKEQVLAIRFADTKKNNIFIWDTDKLLTIRVQKEISENDPLFVASDTLYYKDSILYLSQRNGWRFHPGDEMSWANPDFDDSHWKFYKPAGLTEPIPESLWNGYGWFRYRFAADSSIYAIPAYLYFYTFGAAEVYLDGKLVRKCGTFSTDPQDEKLYNFFNYKTHPVVILQNGESHVLAVRYSYHKGPQYKKLLGKYAGTFGFYTGLAKDGSNQKIISKANGLRQFGYILGTMFFLIVLLHGFVFVLFSAERSNLYITVLAFLFLLGLTGIPSDFIFELDVLQRMLFVEIPTAICLIAALSMFPLTINSMFNQRPRFIHKIIIWLSPVFTLATFIFSDPLSSIIAIILPLVSVFLSIQVLVMARRKNQRGVWFVSGGFLGLVLGLLAAIFYANISQNTNFKIVSVLLYIVFASFPLGLIAFMASRFRDLYSNLEQKVHDRTIELEHSLTELKSTQSQLIQSEKMASLGQLTAGIAHEIQNPLNFVNNFSEINKELIDELKEELAIGNRQSAEELADDIKENEEKINHHGKRAESIVKGMLQHSRANTGHKEPTDINKLADEYLRLAYHGMRAKDKNFNAEFKTNFDPNLPKINVIPQDIGRVLLNLINNAFYAVDKRAKEEYPLTPPAGGEIKNDQNIYRPTVTISTTSSKSPSGDLGVKVVIKDNGPGIPAHIVDKIFQPFFTTKPTGQGTGLGLSLAYEIVKAHGGELKVETKEGEGSEFIIQLPIKM